MQKVIETKDNYRIVQNDSFIFDTGATKIHYTVERYLETIKTVERWYGFKTERVFVWQPVTSWLGFFTIQIFKTKKIAQKYVAYQIKNEINVILPKTN